jgi:hypothetical protein
MSRPPDYEWEVLGEGQDPIPGDPSEIRNESGRLGKMAQTILDQIQLLKDIASDENAGKFHEKLAESANELKGDLTKVADRYEAVSHYLDSWADDLEHAQSESLRALHRAQQIAPAANAPQMTQAPDPKHPLTDQQKHQEAAANKAHQHLQHELDACKKQLTSAKEYRDHRGHHWMQKIEDSEHDGLKDSRWDGIKNWIHEHAGWIKILADACTWVVTILVIVSLFVPGLDLATGPLAALMLAALLGHTALALSGDGSWMDVGMDVFALCTLGSGSLLKVALKGTVDAVEGTADATEVAADATEVTGDSAEAVDTGANAVDAADAADATEDGAKATEDASKVAEDTEDTEAGSADEVENATTEADKADAALQTDKASRAQTVADWSKAVSKKLAAGGENDFVEQMEKLHGLAEQFPDSPQVADALSHGTHLLYGMRVSFGAANVADQFTHWAGGSDDINLFRNAFGGDLFAEGHSIWNPNVENSPLLDFKSVDDFKELTTTGAWE